MTQFEYDLLKNNLPEINPELITGIYSSAMKMESTNTVLHLVFGCYNIGFSQYFPLRLILTIEEAEVKTDVNGWEELGDIKLGFDLKTQSWFLIN